MSLVTKNGSDFLDHPKGIRFMEILTISQIWSVRIP
jgi:hypothetical protein